MRPNYQIPAFVLIISLIVGLTLSVGLVSQAIWQHHNQQALALVTAQALAVEQPIQTRIGLPVRLKIPRLKIDATIEDVGLTADGAMGVTKSLANVAWYQLGVRPGDLGTAVIAGHYGWEDGQAAVFDTLHTLHAGDTISVEDDHGQSISFVVRDSRRYDPQTDATKVFQSNDGQAHLNLITCGGVWSVAEQSYSNRLVIFTDRD